MSDELYRLLVERGYPQHEAHAIASMSPRSSSGATGKQCRSCADNPGRVLKGDGEPIAKNAPCVVCTGTKDCEIYGCFEGRRL